MVVVPITVCRLAPGFRITAAVLWVNNKMIHVFDGLQKKLLLGNKHPECPGFAIGILKGFGKRCYKYMKHLASSSV
jgi:hypothetical protein